MSETKEAAERLRRWKEDCFTCNMAVVGADRAELADAWLAEHLPDDGNAIDEYWLIAEYKAQRDENSTGSRIRFLFGEWFVCIDYMRPFRINREFPATFDFHAHQHAQSSRESVEWRSIQTRGQLRLLLRALEGEP